MFILQSLIPFIINIFKFEVNNERIRKGGRNKIPRTSLRKFDKSPLKAS